METRIPELQIPEFEKCDMVSLADGDLRKLINMYVFVRARVFPINLFYLARIRVYFRYLCRNLGSAVQKQVSQIANPLEKNSDVATVTRMMLCKLRYSEICDLLEWDPSFLLCVFQENHIHWCDELRTRKNAMLSQQKYSSSQTNANMLDCLESIAANAERTQKF